MMIETVINMKAVCHVDGFAPMCTFMYISVALTLLLWVLTFSNQSRLYGLISWYYEDHQRVQDGVVIASLLDHNENVAVGTGWWVHDSQAHALRRKQKWHAGTVVEVRASTFVVQIDQPSGLPPDGSVKERTELPLDTNLTSAELVRLSTSTLRCVDFSALAYEVLADDNPNPTPETHALARPCKPGDIDLFVSHSWHDDPGERWMSLVQAAEDFKQERGRWPVLWLDKVCIDQQDIGRSLKCLPVYLLACKAMLVLGGPTYITRLWCIWELYALFAVSDGQPVIDVREFGRAPGSGQNSLRQQLLTFDVAEHANCYDPNEQAKLLQAIGTAPGGVAGFNRVIRDLSSQVLGAGNRRPGQWRAPTQRQRQRSASALTEPLMTVSQFKKELGAAEERLVARVEKHHAATEARLARIEELVLLGMKHASDR